MEHTNDLLASATAYVDEVWEDVVADIDSLVQVESVEDREHATEGAPFGPAPHEAVLRALRIADKLGLSTQDCEGYLGYAELEGSSEQYLATIAHADIVPLGSGWTFDPLRVTRKEGYLLGRGVIDDKGPLVLSLYAAHYFVRETRRTGVKLPYTLRCLVGSNEETEMEDVDYYLARYPEPLFCFTPDAVFPLICGEKGRFFAEVRSASFERGSGSIVSLEGGTVSNAIPGAARAVVRCGEELDDAEGVHVLAADTDDDGNPLFAIEAQGVGGHASMPEGTRNAIGMLVDYLLSHDLCTEQERAFLDFETALFSSTDGSGLGIAATDDLFDPLTCIGGTIRTVEQEGQVHFLQTMDIRYPKSTTGAVLKAAIERVAHAHDCTVVDTSDAVPFYQDPTSEPVRALVDTFNAATGRNEAPITIGGGTYARHFAHAVAFGPDDPSNPAPAWVGQEHGPDEGVSEQVLKRALAIYIVAIRRLMELSYE